MISSALLVGMTLLVLHPPAMAQQVSCKRVMDHKLDHCICTENPYDSHFPELYCQNMDNPMQLARSLRTVQENGQTISTLYIKDSVMNYFLDDMFKLSPISKFLVDDSQIVSLWSPNGRLFVGAEDSLKTVSIWNNQYIRSWNWKSLQYLKKFEGLQIGDSPIYDVHKEFFLHLPPTTVDLRLIRDEIWYIDNEALRNLYNLLHLDLEGNKLQTLPHYFPSTLISFNLRSNKIKTMPPSFISNFRHLRTVDLSNNDLKTLNRQDIEVANAKLPGMNLVSIDINDNPLDCCSFTWLVDLIIKSKFKRGTCDRPAKFQGSALSSLSRDLFFTCRSMFS